MGCSVARAHVYSSHSPYIYHIYNILINHRLSWTFNCREPDAYCVHTHTVHFFSLFHFSRHCFVVACRCVLLLLSCSVGLCLFSCLLRIALLIYRVSVLCRCMSNGKHLQEWHRVRHNWTLNNRCERKMHEWWQWQTKPIEATLIQLQKVKVDLKKRRDMRQYQRISYT